ncbi:hypothetical protein [Winslowiella arboricola]|uniref:hypothetical protein n=1 Tax=Winslowiella arboricola TaxID=2978220 RepID=UPI00225DEC4F|nr:hypothetical protein [Winslowiella arboricola]MCU5775240.1 hypothetical protein [Winslowiella arboricola]
MAEYTVEIRNAFGRFFASPDYTPLVLAQVIDTGNIAHSPTGGAVFNTTIPAGNKCVAFCKINDSVASCLFEVFNNGGVKAIRIKASTGGSYLNCRFYVFADYLTYIPDYGIFIYNSAGRIVYTGNCLPLNIKYYTRGSAESGVPSASVGGFSHMTSSGIPGQQGEFIYAVLSYVGYSGGVRSIPYYVNTGTSSLPDFGSTPGCSYIETAIYDQYYKQSLGLS